jgi:electron transfer flavoprotein beta subunit
MKILVAVKRVLDFNVRVRVKSDQTDVDLAQAKMSINPFCEIAVEEALRLREAGIASEVIAVSVGEAVAQETLRHALALGADRAIWVEGPSSQRLEPLCVAKTLAAVVARVQPQLVILGKQAIDDDNNQTGQMLAGLLNWPQGTFISKLTINTDKTKAIVVREIDGGLETIEFNLPVVVTTDLRLNTPRYASLPNIMKAKQKTIEHLSAADLGITFANHVNVLAVTAPAARKAGIKVNDVAELMRQLQQAQVV